MASFLSDWLACFAAWRPIDRSDTAPPYDYTHLLPAMPTLFVNEQHSVVRSLRTGVALLQQANGFVRPIFNQHGQVRDCFVPRYLVQ